MPNHKDPYFIFSMAAEVKTSFIQALRAGFWQPNQTALLKRELENRLELGILGFNYVFQNPSRPSEPLPLTFIVNCGIGYEPIRAVTSWPLEVKLGYKYLNWRQTEHQVCCSVKISPPAIVAPKRSVSQTIDCGMGVRVVWKSRMDDGGEYMWMPDEFQIDIDKEAASTCFHHWCTSPKFKEFAEGFELKLLHPTVFPKRSFDHLF